MNPISSSVSSGNTQGSLYSTAIPAKKTPEDNQDKKQLSSQTSSAIDIQSTAEVTSSETTSGSDNTSIPPAYSVEISEQGSRLQAASKPVNPPPPPPPKGSSSDSQTMSTDKAGQSASTSSNSTASTATSDVNSDDESDTANLSIYSAYQLKQLLTDGKITQGEYDAELATRQAASKTEDAGAVSKSIDPVE